MKTPYLEVTYRKGWPLAAYLYLPRDTSEKSVLGDKREPGMIVDLTEEGEAIGIEITAPGMITIADLNAVLHDYEIPLVSGEEFSPLEAASGKF